MYVVRVRDRVMIAHSLRGELFGPAQRRHGATLVVDVEFRGPELGAEDVLVDIGRARAVLREILSEIDYCDLDEHPDFAGRNSTTEVVARWIFERMAQAVRNGRLGPGAAGVDELSVELAESDIAWAGYRGRIGG
jgi:6-pyruvoyl-tetrahydropterin synthase